MNQVAILIAGVFHRSESRLTYDRDKPRDLVVVGIALGRRDGLSFSPPPSPHHRLPKRKEPHYATRGSENERHRGLGGAFRSNKQAA
jgi:hypothetical protein